MESPPITHCESPRRSPSSAPVPQRFIFVEVERAKNSLQGRRNARSFVMQKARKENPWSTSKHVKQRNSLLTASSNVKSIERPGLPCRQDITSIEPTYTESKSNLNTVRRQTGHMAFTKDICRVCYGFCAGFGQIRCSKRLCDQPSLLGHELGSPLVDPFGTSSVAIDAGIAVLLDHFMTNMAPNAIALDVRHRSHLMRSHWVGTAVGDAGFMHSVLCTIAVHQYIMGIGNVNTVFHHRAYAIVSINAALKDPNVDNCISDANIGAVFNLLSVEESLLNPLFNGRRAKDDIPHQRSIHLNGLKKMIQLRGGLLALRSNRILQAFILWHSTAHAVASLDTPYFSSIDSLDACSGLCHSTLLDRKLSKHLLTYCGKANVKDTLITLVHSLLTLAAKLNVHFDVPDNSLDPLDTHNHACILQCMLLKWLHDFELQITPLEDALCVALLIFTVRTTEALHRRSHVHSLHFAASKRLEKALRATSRSEWQRSPKLLLWILVIAAISAEGSSTSPWFVHRTSLVCAELGISNERSFFMLLHTCGWVNFKLDQDTQVLWARIIELRSGGHEFSPSSSLIK